MDDREFYQVILGLSESWAVELKEADQVVWVGEREGTRFTCPECGERSPIYDRQERRWRHLDTCQFTTTLCARVPRVECAAHGVKTVRVPWAEPGSRFTLLFERLAVCWMKEASLSAVSRRLGISRDETQCIYSGQSDVAWCGERRRAPPCPSHVSGSTGRASSRGIST